VYLGSFQDNELRRPIGLFSRKVSLVGAKMIAVLLETLMAGGSLFTRPPLKVVEIRRQVADEQRQLAGRGYDGLLFRLNGQTDVVRM
jgi:hypothetical protein